MGPRRPPIGAAGGAAASRDGTPGYDGAVVAYAVAGGVVHPAATDHLEDVTRDDPRAQADPATCAAAG